MKHAANNPNIVTVATFNSLAEAEGLKSLLQRAGVDAQVQDETNLQKYWFMVAPKAGIHVRVPAASFSAAHKILNDQPAARFRQQAIRCPSCDSALVQYPALARTSMLPTLFMQVLMLLHIVEPKHYCESCHFTWSQKPARSSRRKAAPSGALP